MEGRTLCLIYTRSFTWLRADNLDLWIISQPPVPRIIWAQLWLLHYVIFLGPWTLSDSRAVHQGHTNLNHNVIKNADVIVTMENYVYVQFWCQMSDWSTDVKRLRCPFNSWLKVQLVPVLTKIKLSSLCGYFKVCHVMSCHVMSCHTHFTRRIL